MELLKTLWGKILKWWNTHKELAKTIALIFFVGSTVFLGTKLLKHVPTPPLAAAQVYDTVEHYQDANNKTVTKIKQTEVEKTQDLIIDSLTKALRISRNNVQSVDHYITKDSIVYRDNISYIPSADSTIIARKDNYVDILAVGKPQGSYIRYSAIDTITRIEAHYNPLFKRAFTDVYLRNSNPNATITNGSSFTIKEKRAWLTIGPSVQYSPFNNTFAVGISAQMPLITFKK